MGADAEGILFWGVWYSAEEVERAEDALADTGEATNLSDIAWDIEKVNRGRDCPEPGPEYPLDAERSDPACARAWESWRERVREWERQQPEYRLAGHASHDGNAYVAVNASRRVAEWDDMLPVESLEVDPTWEPRLREYVAALGLPWKQPGWFITSRYS